MRRSLTAILPLALPVALVLAACADTSTSGMGTAGTTARADDVAYSDRPQVSLVENVRLNAKVMGIDKTARTVILRYPNGEEEAVTAGPEVRNFDQINVGDTVLAEYSQLTNIFARPAMSGSSATPTATQSTASDRARVGEMPRASSVQTTELVAVVEKIDPATRNVTLRGPQGRTRTVQVSPDVQGLEKVKAGDEVVVRRTEAIGLAVVR
jgi:hypothetical protein